MAGRLGDAFSARVLIDQVLECLLHFGVVQHRQLLADVQRAD
jgi:hypothetical protein